MMVCTSARAVGVQFFRTLMLVVLGLSMVALLSGPSVSEIPGMLLLCSAVLAFGGSVAWTLGRVAGGWWMALVLFGGTAGALLFPWNSAATSGGPPGVVKIAVSFSSAALLGSMMAAMLLGHSYLIAPTMSIEPLKRLVILVGVSLTGRVAVAALGLLLSRSDAAESSSVRSLDAFGWSLFSGRWVIGLFGPAIVAWMVWQTAKIRSTQAATGILYVGVILTFFGELTGQLLASRYAFAL